MEISISARDEDLGVDHRNYSLPDPALPAVSMTALVPYHPHCEPFHGERTVNQLELVGTVVYEPLRDQGHEVRLRHDLGNEQE